MISANKKDQSLSHSRPASAIDERGFSLVELLVVVALIMVFLGFTMFALTPSKSAYKTDDQALRVLDYIREASLRALTQRQTMRVELNLQTNVIKIIDENLPGTANDDTLVRSMALESTLEVKMSSRPANILILPPAPSNFPVAVFANSVHPTSVGNSCLTLRFRSNGTVVNAGTDATGSGSVVTSSTIFVWQPQPGAPTQARIPGSVRAITVFGMTAAVRFWKYRTLDSTFITG